MESHLAKIEAELQEMRQELSAMMDVVREGPPNPSIGAVAACIVTSMIAIGVGLSAHLRILTSPQQEANPTINIDRPVTHEEMMQEFTNSRLGNSP